MDQVKNPNFFRKFANPLRKNRLCVMPGRRALSDSEDITLASLLSPSSFFRSFPCTVAPGRAFVDDVHSGRSSARGVGGADVAGAMQALPERTLAPRCRGGRCPDGRKRSGPPLHAAPEGKPFVARIPVRTAGSRRHCQLCSEVVFWGVTMVRIGCPIRGTAERTRPCPERGGRR